MRTLNFHEFFSASPWKGLNSLRRQLCSTPSAHVSSTVDWQLAKWIWFAEDIACFRTPRTRLPFGARNRGCFSRIYRATILFPLLLRRWFNDGTNSAAKLDRTFVGRSEAERNNGVVVSVKMPPSGAITDIFKDPWGIVTELNGAGCSSILKDPRSCALIIREKFPSKLRFERPGKNAPNQRPDFPRWQIEVA